MIEDIGPQHRSMRIFVQPMWRIMVETDGLAPAPFGARLQRLESLPTYEFMHSNFYTAEHARDLLEVYVNEHILKVKSTKTKPVKVRADRR